MENNNTPRPQVPNGNKRIISSIISLLMLGLMIGLIWSALKVEPTKTDDEYYQVVQYFDEGKVTEYDLNIATRSLTYVLKGETEKRTYEVPSTDLFYADIHNSVREYNKAHPDNPIKMNYEYSNSGYWLVQLLPMAGLTIILAIMLFWAVKKMSNSMLDDTKRSMAFGKARLKTGEDSTKTTFDDVAGLDEEKEDLEEIVDFLKTPEKFSDLGARIPKGVILVGPPGTGKTLLARAVAGEADATFLSISGSDFVEMYVGVGASRVRDLFDNAKKNVPSIIFIDEIDAVGRHRGAGMGGGHDEREQTLNQLLVEMDGFGENLGVIVMAATNRPDILDPALLRPGRFDRQITVNYPDVGGREAILKVHARNKPLAPDVDLGEIARATSGFTGADLENLLNEAALLTARRGRKAVSKLEIEEATVKVIVGTEKKSKKITDDEKKLTSYHEAGHAITNYYLDNVDPVHQISIIPRGMAGGYTMSLPKEDKSSYISKKQMLDQLVTLLGGRVAEALILGDISTGASNDIERATNIARSMITKYGMSERLGPITYGSENDEVFLGKSYNHVRNYSEATASAIDNEVEVIMTDAYDRADEILRLHVKQLHILASFLMKYEKIDSTVFEKLMSDEDFDVEHFFDEAEKSEPAEESALPELTPEDENSAVALVPTEEESAPEEESVQEELTSEEEPVAEEEPAPEEDFSAEEALIEEELLPTDEEPGQDEENLEVDETTDSDVLENAQESLPVGFEEETTDEEAEEGTSEQDDQPDFLAPMFNDEDVNSDVMAVKATTDSFDNILDTLQAAPAVDAEELSAAADELLLNAVDNAAPEALAPTEPHRTVLEPKKINDDAEVTLTEAELQLKRELDRENGLISAEDEYAYADLGPDAMDDSDISEYLDEKPKKPTFDEEPVVEGMSGKGLESDKEKKEEKKTEELLPGMVVDEELQNEIDQLNAEPFDIGGFISRSSNIYNSDEERDAVEKVLGKRSERKKSKKNDLPLSEDSTPAPDEVAEGFNYATARDEGNITENDEIYALYELLKATRDFDEEKDDHSSTKKKKTPPKE